MLSGIDKQKWRMNINYFLWSLKPRFHTRGLYTTISGESGTPNNGRSIYFEWFCFGYMRERRYYRINVDLIYFDLSMFNIELGDYGDGIKLWCSREDYLF